MESKYLVVRLNPKQKKWIKQLALDSDLTITDLVINALEKYEANKEDNDEKV